MRSREVQQFLASITDKTPSEVDQRCRPLRERLKISSGPRGLAAPHMDIGEGMLHVLAMASRRVADSLVVASSLAELRLHEHAVHPGLTSVFKSDTRIFSLFLLMGMRGGLEQVGFDIRSFEMQDDGAVAWMNFDRRTLLNVRFCFSKNPEADANAYDRLAASNRFVVGRGHLRMLGDRLLRDSPIAPVPDDEENAADDIDWSALAGQADA